MNELATPRGAVLLAGWAAAVAAAFLGLAAGDKLLEAEQVTLPELKLDIAQDGSRPRATGPLESYNVILSRNLFGATAPVSAAQPVAANVARPKLRLVGTNPAKGSNSFAIIEDLNKNEQDVFSLNEPVFGGGKLIDIQSESVKLQYSDRVDTLALEEGSAAPGGGGGETASGGEQEGTDFNVAENELNEALANLPLLLSQARAVPYFRNGQSIGMRLFAIRYGSMYEKLGLKNGDIVLAVNENSLSDPSQALKLFEQLKNERSVTVKLERNGENKEMHYTIR